MRRAGEASWAPGKAARGILGDRAYERNAVEGGFPGVARSPADRILMGCHLGSYRQLEGEMVNAVGRNVRDLLIWVDDRKLGESWDGCLIPNNMGEVFGRIDYSLAGGQTKTAPGLIAGNRCDNRIDASCG